MDLLLIGGISGSGPSIFMLSKTREAAENVKTAMDGVYGETNIGYNTYVSEIHPNGVRLRKPAY